MSWEAAFRRSRRAPLVELDMAPNGLMMGQDVLETILPHRPPLLLIDTIVGVDLEAEVIVGTRHLCPEDPVFAGHFPTMPLYPGSLQLEMAGQLALCLHYFVQRGSVSIAEAEREIAPPVLVTGVLRASFLHPLVPGSHATILSRTLDQDSLRGTALVQTLVGDRICSSAVIEVCFT